MFDYMPVFRLAAKGAGVLALIAIVVAFRMRAQKHSYVATALAALPGFVMLGLYYSLAIHMRQSLGEWPSAIGEHGFPAALITHVSVARNYCFTLLLLSIFVWPAAFILCTVDRLRGFLFYLGVYAFSFLVCVGTMALAPSQYLHWWWD